MKTLLELRERARREDARLRAVEESLLVGGEESYCGVPGLAVLVRPSPTSERPHRHLVALGVHPPVRPVLCELACGVLDEHGALVSVARSDRQGFLWVDLPPDGFRLRFVDDVRDELDREILTRLDDRSAHAQLEIVDTSNTHQLEPSGRDDHGLLSAGPVISWGAAAASLDDEGATYDYERSGPIYTIKDGWFDFTFRVRADDEQHGPAVPFGAVLLEWRRSHDSGDGQEIVHRSLLPVRWKLDDAPTWNSHRNVAPLAELLPDDVDVHALSIRIYGDSRHLLMLATQATLDAWLDTYGELWGDEWRGRIERLRELLIVDGDER